MVNKYKERFKQLDGISASRVVYDDGELRIEALNRAGSVVVLLQFYDVLLTRISDEGTQLRLLQELGSNRALVFEVQQSDIVTWLLGESLHTRDLKDAKHFLIFIGEEIVDVISFSEPEISISTDERPD